MPVDLSQRLAAHHLPWLGNTLTLELPGSTLLRPVTPCGKCQDGPLCFFRSGTRTHGPERRDKYETISQQVIPTFGRNRFPFNNFKFFELSFQSSLHLSLALLVLYRSLIHI